ncbi:MAG: TPR repeat-containing protein, partial [Elusimicrobia bacterium]
LQRDGENVALRTHIGEIYFLKGDLETAAVHFQHAKAAQPDNPGACLWLAILAEQKGDFSGAADVLAQSASLKDEAALNLRLSYYLTQANRLKEAVAVLEAGHKKWPNNDEISYFLALGYDDLKQLDKAVVLLKDVLKSKPDFRDARFQLGALYEKNNRIEDAEREFRALIEQRPNDASALNYLGYSLTDRGLKLPEAEGLIRRAVAADPGNGAYRDSLGWSHYKQGRYLEARAELLAAAKALPTDGTVWDHVGDVYQVFGDTGAAWTAWRKADAYESSEKVRKKLAAAEGAMAPDDLGRRSLELAAAPLADLKGYGGACEITGTVLGRPVRYAGLLSYRAPAELSLDLLGPLFVPVFRIRLSGEDSFEMDPIRIEGIDPEVLQDAVYRSFQLMRDYLRGRLFEGRPAEHH